MASAQQPELDRIDQLLLWGLQDHLPLNSRPFLPWAKALGVSEHHLVDRLARWQQQGLMSRFGPFIQVERAGGIFVLAAVSVPEKRFDQVVEQINAFPEVAHHYLRNHALNCWFVLACLTRERVEEVVQQMQTQTGLPVFLFPKEAEYFVRLRLLPWSGDDGPTPQQLANWEALLAKTRPQAPDRPESDHFALTAIEHQLLLASQQGLPIAPQPFRALAAATGMDEETILETFSSLLRRGIVRRLGVAVNHYALGYRANAMCVWDVPDTMVDTVGRWLGESGEVSHCYRRPRHFPHWRYNLFFMLHGRSTDEVEARRQRLATEYARRFGQPLEHQQALYSTRILKKTGVRLPTA